MQSTENMHSNPSVSGAKGAGSVGGPATGADASTSEIQSKGRFWFFVIFIVLISALGSFVNDMFTPALPAMCRFFHASVSTAQMGLTTGMIGLAIGQFLLGPISDHIGRKPVLYASMALFIVAAVVSVFSPTIHFFIGCRLFQGIGASGGYFLARTMTADRYSGRALARLMALIGAINGVAPASAPVLGGVAADAYGWRGIFVILAIFAALILCVTPFVKESLPKDRRTTGPLLSLFAGYKVLLRRKVFMIHVIFKGLALGLLFAYVSAAPFILQDHYGFSQTMYGLIIGGNALFVVTGATIAVKFYPLKRAASIGTLIVAIGVISQAIALWTIKSFWVFEGCVWVMLFGLGLIFTVTNTLAMNECRDKAGEGSSILGIMGYIVGAIVSPLVGVGDILHSTAIVFVAVTVVMAIMAVASARQRPDLDTPQ